MVALLSGRFGFNYPRIYNKEIDMEMWQALNKLEELGCEHLEHVIRSIWEGGDKPLTAQMYTAGGVDVCWLERGRLHLVGGITDPRIEVDDAGRVVVDYEMEDLL